MELVSKLMNKFSTLGKMAEIIGAELPESINRNETYGRVLTQHVYVQPGDVVICGKWYPEYTTVKESLERGALAVFCSEKIKKQFPQDNVIAIEDPLMAVTLYQKWCARVSNAKRIAITGSVGKTTTTGLINSVIANSFKTLTHHSAANSHGAVLRNVQRLESAHEYWVQEVGGVQPEYIESTARFLCPDIVVLTNIGESHLNLYGTKENILKDKGSLERYAKPDAVVVISKDDEILRNASFSHRVVTCSLQDPDADYYADQIRTELDGTYLTVHCEDGDYEVHLNLYGEYNAYNALFAVAVGRLAGVSMPKIVELLETYYPSGMRQNLIRVGGYKLFVDVFNAEPKTVVGSAETLEKMPLEGTGRKIFVTGHIDKLGPESAKMHEDVGHKLAKLKLDVIVLYAEDSKYTYKALKEDGFENAFLMQSRDELDDWLRNNVTRDDVVFFKSGQFAAALVKSIDHVFGTSYQNEQQFNEGRVVTSNGYQIRLRMDNIAEIEGYKGNETDLVLPEKYEEYTITRIAPFAFRRNLNLTSITIPDTVVNIGREAFYICPKLKRVTLPNQLKIIDNNAFNYCKAMEHIVIPEGTIHIGRHAFYDCMSLKTIRIPDSVGYFDRKVFGLDKPTENRKLKVVCTPGSLAEQYAKENGLQVCTPEETDTQLMQAGERDKPTIADRVVNKVKGTVSNALRQAGETVGMYAPYPKMNPASQRIFDYVKKEIGVEPAPLTPKEMEAFKRVWGDLYDRGIANPQWAGLYKAKTGEFNPEYIGHDIHQHIVEKKLVDTTYIRGLCDKNMMPLVLPIGKHPVTLLRKLSGHYLDRDFNPVNEDEAIAILMENRRKGAVIKYCRSSGGKGVVFVGTGTGEQEIRSALRGSPYITVQAAVKQHPEMAKMNPTSVNTVRIMTIMIKGEVYVLSSVVRIGKFGSRVDNFHSGGMSCGIKEDGTLNEFASFVNGDRAKTHESGFVFAKGRIPNFERILNETKRLHHCLPMFGVISWDMCIDEIGDPVLIEYNIGGGITVHQLSNGPLYGKHRQEIIKAVLD